MYPNISINVIHLINLHLLAWSLFGNSAQYVHHTNFKLFIFFVFDMLAVIIKNYTREEKLNDYDFTSSELLKNSGGRSIKILFLSKSRSTTV